MDDKMYFLQNKTENNKLVFYKVQWYNLNQENVQDKKE